MTSNDAANQPIPPLSGSDAVSVSPSPATRFASPSQLRWVGVAIVLAALLFGEEFLHYVIATDAGSMDLIQVSARVHPQCKELDTPYDLQCPMPGYNSVLLECNGVNCGPRNPNAPPTSDSSRKNLEIMSRADSVASLRVEAPYSRHDPAWRQNARDLATNSSSVPFRGDLNRRPQTVEEAWPIIQGRNLSISRQIAQEWLEQHAR